MVYTTAIIAISPFFFVRLSAFLLLLSKAKTQEQNRHKPTHTHAQLNSEYSSQPASKRRGVLQQRIVSVGAKSRT